MTTKPTYYDILGVVVDASPREIKLAYLNKALTSHPDQNPHQQKQAAEEFRLLQEAYETLEDIKRRKAYDQANAQRLQEDKEAVYQRTITKVIEALMKDHESNKQQKVTHLFENFKKNVAQQALELQKSGFDPDPNNEAQEKIRIEEMIFKLQNPTVPNYVWTFIKELQDEITQTSNDRIEKKLHEQLLKKMAQEHKLLELLLTNGEKDHVYTPAIRLNYYSNLLGHDELKAELLQSVLDNNFLRLSLFKSMADIEGLHTYGGIHSALHRNMDLRVDLAKTGIHAYRLLPRRGPGSVLGWFTRWWDRDREWIRANVYNNLLEQAKSPLEKKLIIYAVFDHRTAGSTLKKYIYKAMGYDSLAEAKKALTSSLEEDFPDKADMQHIDKLLGPIIYNANHKKPATDPAYNFDIDKVREFIETRILKEALEPRKLVI
jgi:hypothetical protein